MRTVKQTWTFEDVPLLGVELMKNNYFVLYVKCQYFLVDLK